MQHRQTFLAAKVMLMMERACCDEISSTHTEKMSGSMRPREVVKRHGRETNLRSFTRKPYLWTAVASGAGREVTRLYLQFQFPTPLSHARHVWNTCRGYALESAVVASALPAQS